MKKTTGNNFDLNKDVVNNSGNKSSTGSLFLSI